MEAIRNSLPHNGFGTVEPPSRHALWKAARYTAFAVAAAEIVGLFGWPEIALVALRDVIIPLVPASLLLNPLIWRNVCPLATANMIVPAKGTRRLSPQVIHTLLSVGIVLFLVLVPARRFLFNQEAAVLSTVIAVLVLGALALGWVFDMKSGFCNAFCPVLPVERLYGFSPLIRVGNHRCLPRCTGCTPACVDLSPQKSPHQALGNARNGRKWFMTPFGMFALAFPGFVLGYYSITDVPFDQALQVYAQILAYSAASLVVLGGIAAVMKIPLGRFLPFPAAAAAGIYYWYSSPTFAGALGMGEVTGDVLRVATLAFIGVWLVVAMRNASGHVPQPRRN